MASQIPPIEVKLIADVQELKAGLEKAEQQIETLKNGTNRASVGMEKFESGVNKAALALTAAAAAAGFFAYKIGKEMVEAAMEDEKAQTLLANRLRNVVGASDAAIASTETFINKLQMASGVSDSKLRPALSQLVGVTKNLESGQKLLKVAMDLSAGSGVELETATKALTRAAQGNYGGLQRMGVVIDETTKKSKDFTGVLSTLQEQFGGAAAAQADTFAGRLKIMQTSFDEMKESIGFALLPALTELFGYINTNIIPILTNWIEKNKEGLIKGFKNAVTQAVAFFNVMVDLFQFVARNIKVFATLGAVIVAAIFGAKVGMAVAAFVKAIQAIIAVMKTLRTVSLATAAANALATGGISAAAGAAAFAVALGGIYAAMKKFNSENDKASGNLENLDMSFKGLDITAEDYKVTLDGVTASTTKAAEATKKLKNELKELNIKGSEIYTDMNKVISEASERKAKAATTRDTTIAAANKRAIEATAAAEKKAAKERAEAQEKFEEAMAEAAERRSKVEIAARKRNTETLIAIAQDYAARTKEINERNIEEIAKANAKADESRIRAEREASNRRLSLITQSIERLRTAFSSKTGFDLAESFKTGGSVERLLTDLKDKLAGAKELQANAAALAGKGYSQVFIEEVVKQGPQVGNEIAKALLAATPEATRELQALYNEVGTISETGLDALAKQMNAGANLATRELREAYAQVAIDLSESLAEINKNLTDELAEANKTYNQALTESKALRDSALAEAAKELTEALDEARAEYDANVAEAQKVLTETLADIQKELDDTLAEIQKDLADSIAAAHAAYNDAVTAIEKDTMAKLEALKAKLAEVAAEMARLGAEKAALALMAGAPVYNPLSTRAISASDRSAASFRAGDEAKWAQYNISQTFNNLTTSAYDVNNATVAGIRYGQAVTVGTSIRAMGRD